MVVELLFMSPYDHLNILCEKPDQDFTNKQFADYSFSVQYIINSIVDAFTKAKSNNPDLKCALKYHKFNNKNINVVMYFPAQNQNTNTFTIGFCAHHDVVHKDRDNAFDNQASVAHLIALAESLLANPPLYHNIILCFTDLEERGGQGAEYLSNYINKQSYGPVKAIFNLELTALGSNYWVDNSNNYTSLIWKQAVQTFTKATHLTIRCPFNDSVVFRKNNIDSSCIGTINRSVVKKIKDKKYRSPPIWSICHSPYDKFELTSKPHMDDFNSLLFNICNHDWTYVFDTELNKDKIHGRHISTKTSFSRKSFERVDFLPGFID